MTINLTPYSVNDEEKCGKLVFTAKSEHKDNQGEPFDVFASGSAEVNGSELVFRNATSYPRGNLEVFVSVAHEFSLDVPVYTSSFMIRIIDCAIEDDYFEFSRKDPKVCEPNRAPGV